MGRNKYDDLGELEKNNNYQTNNKTAENAINNLDSGSAVNSSTTKSEKSALIKKRLPSLGLTVEPIEFCTAFALAITNGVTIDMIERSVCLQRFNMTVEECISSSSQIKSYAEEATANINMAMRITQGTIPLLLAILIGPWSDSNGRKPFMLISLQGYTIYYLLWTLMSIFPNIPVLYLVLPSVYISATGGSIALQACLTSYICDVFQNKQRTFRLTLRNCFGTLGIITANLMAPAIKTRWPDNGFTIVFLICSLISAASLVYASFYLKETIKKNENERAKLFGWNNFKSMFKALLYKPKNGLFTSILIMTVVAAEVTSNQGNDNIIYLVTKSQYSWSLHDYSLFKAVDSALASVLPLVLVWLLNDLLNISNMVLLLICGVVISTMEVTKGFATNDKVFFAAQCTIDNFGKMIASSIDVILSTIVQPQDLGKACAFLSFVDATSPVISQPLYTELYKYLLPFRSIRVFFLSAALNVVITLCALCLILKSKFGQNKVKDESLNK